MSSLLDPHAAAQATALAGELHVATVQQKSAVLTARAGNPLKLLIPQQNAQAVWAYTTSYGGGIVSGDDIRLDVKVDRDARLFCGTQASTKVFKQRDPHEITRQQLTATCADKSVLVSLPDPVVCFAGAVFEQSQIFHCTKTSSLLAVDWFTAGRIARGERWAFNSLTSRMQLWIDDQLVLDDPLQLRDEAAHLSITRRMQQFNIFGSVILVGPEMHPLCERLEQRLHAALRPQARVLESVSPITGGCVWRFAAEDIDEMQSLLFSHVDDCKNAMGGDPWRRRP